jgi:hypothetical protein
MRQAKTVLPMPPRQVLPIPCNTITVPGMPWWEQRVLLEMGEKKERAWHLHTLPGVCDVQHPPAVETHYYWHCKAMTVHG